MARTSPHPAPGLLDRLDLLLLRLAKRGRQDLTDSAGHGDFYDSFFTEEDAVKYAADVRNAWRYGAIRRVMDDLFGERPFRMADIGAGLGMLARYLPPGADFTGIEYAPATLEAARRLNGRRPASRFIQGGFPALPADDGAFDLVVCTEVVEHIKDDRQAIGELWRIVRPGGWLLLTVPGTYYWPDYERLIGHFRHYTGPGLDALLTAAGFTIDRHLPQHSRFWRGYHYVYALARVGQSVLRRLGWRHFDLFSTGLYRWQSRRILQRLATADRRSDPASTFVLARRPLPESTGPENTGPDRPGRPA
ncbi:MAG: class I SAM-dependent methyltransferase [Alphaproteobacteria bacterium]